MTDSLYDNYYSQQVGSGLPVYGGVSVQRGHGLGSILGGLFRGALPILKGVGKAVGKQLIKSGLNVANDVVAGRNLKNSLKRRAREGASSLLANQSGSGLKRRRRNAKIATSQKATTRKRRKREISPDIFY